MKSQQKIDFLLLLLLIKKFQLKSEDTNISLNDLMIFLDKFYFDKEKFSKKQLTTFVKDDNNKVIVDYL
jgi:hypothetical protein